MPYCIFVVVVLIVVLSGSFWQCKHSKTQVPLPHLNFSLHSTSASWHRVAEKHGRSSISSTLQAEPPNWDGVRMDLVRNCRQTYRSETRVSPIMVGVRGNDVFGLWCNWMPVSGRKGSRWTRVRTLWAGSWWGNCAHCKTFCRASYTAEGSCFSTGRGRNTGSFCQRAKQVNWTEQDRDKLEDQIFTVQEYVLYDLISKILLIDSTHFWCFALILLSY